MIPKSVEADINLSALLGLRACMARLKVSQEDLTRVWACDMYHTKAVLSNTVPLTVAHVFLFCSHYGIGTDLIYRFVPTEANTAVDETNVRKLVREMKKKQRGKTNDRD